MDISYGQGPAPAHVFSSIAGYVIRVGLDANAGIEDNFLVSVLLKDNASRFVRSLITQDARFGDPANPVRDNLTLWSGAADNPTIRYVFPGIEFSGWEVVYSNQDRYQLLHFQYTGKVMTPGAANGVPVDFTLANGKAQTITHENARARGTLQLQGVPVAYLLGVEAYQANGGNSGLRLTSERCSAGGWLNKIKDQNAERCNNAMATNLTFNMNGQGFACDPTDNAPGLTYLIYEEYFGLGLYFPWADLQDVCAQGTPSFRPLRLRDLRHPDFSLKREWLALTAEGYYQDYRANAPENGVNFAAEVCTLVHGSQDLRQFDWRTAPQRTPPEAV